MPILRRGLQDVRDDACAAMGQAPGNAAFVRVSPQEGCAMDKKTYDRGLEIRTEVLGKEYVENALRNSDAFNKPMQDLVTEYCWGYVWGREALPRKTRSMLNLAMIGVL